MEKRGAVTSVGLGARPDSSSAAVRGRVLVVDDQKAARVVASAILADDFDVATAQSGEEALAYIVAGGRVDVLCTDYGMPGMDGITLVARVAAVDPSVQALLITGHHEFLARKRTAGPEASYLLLLKPYDPDELVSMIRRSVDRSTLQRNLGQLARSPVSAKSVR